MGYNTSAQTQGFNWNANQSYLEVLKVSMLKINEAAGIGDFRSWLNYLRILYRTIYGYGKMDMDKLRQTGEKMDKASSMIKSIPFNVATDERQRLMLDSALKLLDEANCEIMEQMFKAGIMMPVQTKDASMAGLEI